MKLNIKKFYEKFHCCIIQIKQKATNLGLKVYGPISQKKFLFYNGINERLLSLVKNCNSKNLYNKIFKTLNIHFFQKYHANPHQNQNFWCQMKDLILGYLPMSTREWHFLFLLNKIFQKRNKMAKKWQFFENAPWWPKSLNQSEPDFEIL